LSGIQKHIAQQPFDDPGDLSGSFQLSKGYPMLQYAGEAMA